MMIFPQSQSSTNIIQIFILTLCITSLLLINTYGVEISAEKWLSFWGKDKKSPLKIHKDVIKQFVQEAQNIHMRVISGPPCQDIDQFIQISKQFMKTEVTIPSDSKVMAAAPVVSDMKDLPLDHVGLTKKFTPELTEGIKTNTDIKLVIKPPVSLVSLDTSVLNDKLTDPPPPNYKLNDQSPPNHKLNDSPPPYIENELPMSSESKFAASASVVSDMKDMLPDPVGLTMKLIAELTEGMKTNTDINIDIKPHVFLISSNPRVPKEKLNEQSEGDLPKPTSSSIEGIAAAINLKVGKEEGIMIIDPLKDRIIYVMNNKKVYPHTAEYKRDLGYYGEHDLKFYRKGGYIVLDVSPRESIPVSEWEHVPDSEVYFVGLPYLYPRLTRMCNYFYPEKNMIRRNSNGEKLFEVKVDMRKNVFYATNYRCDSNQVQWGYTLSKLALLESVSGDITWTKADGVDGRTCATCGGYKKPDYTYSYGKTYPHCDSRRCLANDEIRNFDYWMWPGGEHMPNGGLLRMFYDLQQIEKKTEKFVAPYRAVDMAKIINTHVEEPYILSQTEENTPDIKEKDVKKFFFMP